jgi:transposase-like protein
MARRGRKDKITPEVIERLTNVLSQGNYVETACAYAGVSKSSFYSWLHEAQKPGAKKKYLEFLEAIEKARAVAEMRNLQIVQQAGQGKPGDPKTGEKGIDPDWRASAWFLERAYPKKWGRQERVELSGMDGAPINVTVDTKTALLEIIREKSKPSEQ